MTDYSLQEGQTINMQVAIGTKFSYGGLTITNPKLWIDEGLGSDGVVKFNGTTGEFYVVYDNPPPPPESNENIKTQQKKILPKRN